MNTQTHSAFAAQLDAMQVFIDASREFLATLESDSVSSLDTKANPNAENCTATEPEVVKDEPEKKVTIEDARAALIALSKRKSRPDAKRVLESFGVSDLNSLDKGKYSELIAACEGVS